MSILEDRLAVLRNYMAEQSVEAFIVPSQDAFQSEYTPDYAKRLTWLTGFDGSNGLAIVTKDQAAFFTDGRYTLQAKEQVPSCYDIYNMVEQSHYQWAAENASNISIDPWLHSIAACDAFEAAGCELQLLEQNPIDALWEGRPETPCEPARIYPIEYAGKSHHDKIADIAAGLNKKSVDAAVITAPDSLCWLLNIRGSDVAHIPLVFGYGIVTASGQVHFFCDLRKITDEVTTHLGDAVQCHEMDAFADVISDVKPGSVLLDKKLASRWFQNALQGIEIKYENDPCQLPKACKNETEVAQIKEAHRKDGIAVSQFLNWVADKQQAGEVFSELDVVAKLIELRKGQPNFVEPSFDTIAGFAEHGAIVHYRVSEQSNKQVEGDGLLLVDSGGQYLEGTTDITRTIAIGTPNAEQIRNYTLVLKGHIAIATAIFPKGTTGSQLDILARQYLWQQGLDYDHGTGHGVGCFLGVHEGPQRISKVANNVALQPGMILSNEPGFYKEGVYGIRIENLVLVVEKGGFTEGCKVFYGFETLSKVPLEPKLVDETLLTEAEKDWLDDYNV